MQTGASGTGRPARPLLERASWRFFNTPDPRCVYCIAFCNVACQQSLFFLFYYLLPPPLPMYLVLERIMLGSLRGGGDEIDAQRVLSVL